MYIHSTHPTNGPPSSRTQYVPLFTSPETWRQVGFCSGPGTRDSGRPVAFSRPVSGPTQINAKSPSLWGTACGDDHLRPAGWTEILTCRCCSWRCHVSIVSLISQAVVYLNGWETSSAYVHSSRPSIPPHPQPSPAFPPPPSLPSPKLVIAASVGSALQSPRRPQVSRVQPWTPPPPRRRTHSRHASRARTRKLRV